MIIRSTWKNLRNIVLSLIQGKTLDSNIGISVTHVVLQEVMDVAQFVPENVTKVIT